MSAIKRHVTLSGLALVLISSAALVAGSAPSMAGQAISVPEVYTANAQKLALNGYDPVAYFVSGAPRKGQAAIWTHHQGVTWRFENEANKTAFLAQPEKFSPQYGGYCAYAVSQGYTASADPTAWAIVDGKLYVNYNHAVRASWSKQSSGYIKSGDVNWDKRIKIEPRTN